MRDLLRLQQIFDGRMAAGCNFAQRSASGLRFDIDKGTSGLDDENFAWSAGLTFCF